MLLNQPLKMSQISFLSHLGTRKFKMKRVVMQVVCTNYLKLCRIHFSLERFVSQNRLLHWFIKKCTSLQKVSSNSTSQQVLVSAITMNLKFRSTIFKSQSKNALSRTTVMIITANSFSKGNFKQRKKLRRISHHLSIRSTAHKLTITNQLIPKYTWNAWNKICWSLQEVSRCLIK